MEHITFASLGLSESLVSAVGAEGYAEPTPIQAEAIPYLLQGKDLLGCAQTGTGKTAAFALPILQRLLLKPAPRTARSVRALVVAPTRELAAQIDASFAAYGRRTRTARACVYGGVGKEPQVRAIARGVDVLIATPGRLLDLHGQGAVRLDAVEVIVLDEADRMLDMGFIQDVKRIIALVPKRRQTMLFSATMPDSIRSLAEAILSDPMYVETSPQQATVELIEQKVMFVDKEDKRALLVSLLTDGSVQRAIVFSRTKHGANRLAEALDKAGIGAGAIHSNKSQSQRTRALDSFRQGKVRVMVATDLAARGIDVDGITHVFNFDLPFEPATYVHRIGRTARAGASGIAITFCDAEERPLLAAIERLIGQRVPVELDHPYAAAFGPLHQEARGGRDRRPRARPTSGGFRHGGAPNGSGVGHRSPTGARHGGPQGAGAYRTGGPSAGSHRTRPQGAGTHEPTGASQRRRGRDSQRGRSRSPWREA